MKKKMLAVFLTAMLTVSLIPYTAFAEEDVSDSTTEYIEPVETDDARIPDVDDSSNGDTTEGHEATEAPAVEEILEDELLEPIEETEETVGTGSMRIYGLYMAREEGSASSTDRFGDAVLIESKGKYLLMDTGAIKPIKNSSDIVYSNLVKTLDSIGVKELDVYISHLHSDHSGDLRRICSNFKVNNLYLPDTEIGHEYATPGQKDEDGNWIVNPISIDDLYASVKAAAQDEQAINPGVNIKYLSPSFRNHEQLDVTDHLTIGDAQLDVIGPVGDFTIEDFAPQDGSCGSKQGHYLNNLSLCSIITCGSFKFITCGDIERQQETRLVEKYGNLLDCDLMKLNHHSLNTSNKDNFYKAITPMWSFTEDHGYGYTKNVTKPSIDGARNYGFNCAVALEKNSFIVDVDDGKVRVYLDKNQNGLIDETPLNGWVKVGTHYQHYTSDGLINQEWGRVSSNAYYFSKQSGFRVTGTKTINGVKCKFTSKGVLKSPTKPAKPVIKTPSSTASNSITAKWKKASRASEYQIYRSTNKSSGFVCVGQVSSSKLTFTDTSVNSGTKYYYKVRAVRNVAGTSLIGSFSKVSSTRAK